MGENLVENYKNAISKIITIYHRILHEVISYLLPYVDVEMVEKFSVGMEKRDQLKELMQT